MNRTTLALLTLALLVAVAAGAAVATPPTGLTSQLLARGTADTLRFQDPSRRLQLHAKQPTDVAVVKAALAAPVPATPTTPAVPGGSTGWHGHPGPSLVIVTQGTLTMLEPRGRKCDAETFEKGRTFVHPGETHNFVNTGTDAVEFYVVYFVPAAVSPLLRDEPVPAACATLR